MQSLSDVGIVSIDLSATEVDETNTEHLVSHRSFVTFANGSTGLIEDIHFQNDLSSSVALLPEDFEYDAEALTIPVLFGYGQITSTWVSLSLDAELRATGRSLLDSLAAGDVASFLNQFDDYVLSWADVDGIDQESRGQHIDARKLVFLERAYGTDFLQGSNSNPGIVAAIELEAFYHDLVQKLAGRFMSQAAVSSAYFSGTNFVEILEDIDTHPLAALSSLTDDYSPQSRALTGDLSTVLLGLESAISENRLTVEAAKLVVATLQADLSEGSDQYEEMITNALNVVAGDFNSEFFKSLKADLGYQIVEGTSDNDSLTGVEQTLFLAGAGNDHIQAGNHINTIVGGAGDDTLVGGTESDTYLYQIGDGNDLISDRDDNYDARDPDTLVFADTNRTDVTFGRVGDDLTLTLTNGEVITVERHFDNTNDRQQWGIENIQFADGTLLTGPEIDSAYYVDGRGTGQITGTELSDIYTHNLGAGSYTISDWDNDYNASDADTLVFADANRADVTFGRVGDDLTLTLTNGEVITVENQHYHPNGRLQWGVESIEFADGATIDRDGIIAELTENFVENEWDDVSTILQTGVTDEFQFGNSWNGLSDPDGEVDVGFQSTGSDMELSLTGYDIDFNDEIEIFLNGEHHSFLSRGQNNDISAHIVEFAANDLLAGNNIVTFANENASWRWGLDDLLIV